MDRNHISLLLLTATILCSFYPTLSTAQGNTSSINPCEANGRCGAFEICNSQNSQICTCLPGFSPNKTGCFRRVSLRCDEANNASSDDGFLRLDIIQTPGYSSRWIEPENDCEGRCLRNCSCMAYAWDVVMGCMIWSGTLMDIKKLPTGIGFLYIRLANSELDRYEKGFKRILIVPVVVGFTFAFVFSYFWWKWMTKKRDMEVVE